MTSQKKMMRATAKPGYWFVNAACLGADPDWVLQVALLKENNLLFGYEQKEFLQKQYKENK